MLSAPLRLLCRPSPAAGPDSGKSDKERGTAWRPRPAAPAPPPAHILKVKQISINKDCLSQAGVGVGILVVTVQPTTSLVRQNTMENML